MTDDELRDHCIEPSVLGHSQPAGDVRRAPIDQLRDWHSWEHHLSHGSRSHVHDEISARRFHLPIFQPKGATK